MANNTFESTVESLFHGMNNMISSKTVVGEAIHVGDTIILPLVDVSFAIGAGAFETASREERRDRGAGGMGGKITPSAVLVIQNGHTRLVNIKNQDTITKLFDLVPDLVDRFTNKDSNMTEQDVADTLSQAEAEQE